MANQTIYPYGPEGQLPSGSAELIRTLQNKTENIEQVGTEETDGKVIFRRDDDTYVGEINDDGAVFNTLRLKKGNEYVPISPDGSNSLILSDIINNNDMFVQSGKLMKQGSFVTAEGNSATLYVNLYGVEKIEYENLHALASDGAYPIYLYTEDFTYLGPSTSIDLSDTYSGSLDMSNHPTARYAVFNNKSDNDTPSIKFFVGTEKAKEERNNILVGAYYFAGWSETDFPNIHMTESLLTTYADRQPIWGWFDHESFYGEGWLITPAITLNSGAASLAVVNSCLFHKDGQCNLFVREVGSDWVDITPTLPDATTTTMTTTTIDISAYAGKTIEIGFRLHTSPSEKSAIWTINRITITSGGSTIYNKDYTNHNNFDCTITNPDVWKPATWTRGYSGLNGYVGTTINQKGSAVIDKQIVLAKAQGLSYFMLEWFYYDDQSSFNEEASYNEDNHIAIHAFMDSCQKLGFQFALMITNHSPFRIVGLQNWKDAIAYLDKEYFHDPSYLVIDNKPVLYVFDKTEYRSAGPAAIDDYFRELGWDGHYMLAANYNEVPNTGAKVEKDISILYDANEAWNIANYLGEHIYNPVTCLTCGWDSRPWAVRPSGYSRDTDWYAPDLDKWKATFDWAYRFARLYNNNKFRSVLICAWNEYGEGSYLAPTDEDSGMIRAIAETIKNDKI